MTKQVLYPVRLNVWIRKEEQKMLEEMRKKLKCRVSDVVRMAINEAWEKI